MSRSEDNLGAFGALTDVVKVSLAARAIGAVVDQVLSDRNTDQDEPEVDFAPPAAPTDSPDPDMLAMLGQVEDMQRQVQEFKALVTTFPTRPKPEPPKAAEPPKPQALSRGLQELNAAVAAYNEAARRLGLVILAGNIDERVERGEPEEADDAISGVICAAEWLMLLGASPTWKADSLAGERTDLKELTASSRATEERLPILLDLAEDIQGKLEEGEE